MRSTEAHRLPGATPADSGVLPHQRSHSRLLQPGRTCWHLAQPDRVAFIFDGKTYFAAAKAALRQARHSILVLGWDFDPRIRLEPDNPQADQPDVLGQLLATLVAERADLTVHVLRWDMPWPIAVHHLMLPLVARNQMTDARLQYRLDDRHPVGTCHHQKIVVIDDAIAFCGGMDFAGNRWDTSAHRDHDPNRRQPNGSPYRPRHDLMMAVDGDAAAALGGLARERWHRATGERLQPPPPGLEAWPSWLQPDLRNVEIGIARTLPAWYGPREIHEVEALYVNAIAQAQEAIVLESEYFTASAIAGALAARLAEPDGPEIVVINTARSPNWFDQRTMDVERVPVIRRLRAADRHNRFQVFEPVTASGQPIVVHSKVAIIDDRLARVGSANLSNRSMGYDTECDLAVEAVAGERSEKQVRQAIAAFRSRLLSEHLGVSVAQFTRTVRDAGSLIKAIEALAQPGRRRLEAIAAPEPSAPERMLGKLHLFDPEGTEQAWQPWVRLPGAWADTRFWRHFGTALAIAALGVAALALWCASSRGR